MGFIPKLSYTIETPHSKDYVIRKLKVSTHHDLKIPNFRSRKYKEPFFGQVDDDTFIISPVYSYYRRSLTPIIRGKVHESKEGTTINITMFGDVLAFWLVWLSLVGLIFLVVLYLMISGQTPFNFGVIIPLIMFCFGYAFGYFGLRYSAMKRKKKLEDLWSHPLKIDR